MAELAAPAKPDLTTMCGDRIVRIAGCGVGPLYRLGLPDPPSNPPGRKISTRVRTPNTAMSL